MKVTQSCLTLCDPTDCSPPGSSVHGILQARILEWVAISFSRGSSRPRDQTQVSYIAGGLFTDSPQGSSFQIFKHSECFLLSHFSRVQLCGPHRQQPTRLPTPWDSPGKNTGVGCYFLLQCIKVKSESEAAQPCPTLSNPIDCSSPGSSIHGVFQARVLE